MFDVELKGCTTEPLVNYLKAVGILRLLAEDSTHGDTEARGSWMSGTFHLRSRFDETGLVEYFSQFYRPTPIVVPWSGSDFFGIRSGLQVGKSAKAPTSTAIIEAFLATDGERLAGYRNVISLTLDIMTASGVVKKTDIEGGKGKETKRFFLAALRSALPEIIVQWLDAAAVIEEDRVAFNVLLGSGGGSDGNSHYSDNFMQNLWDCLPEFDGQRTKPRIPGTLENALFGSPAKGFSDRTASLFNSGAVGGPNATSGFEGDSILNSWDFVLAMEGTLCFAGAVARKLGSHQDGSAFPFAVSMSPVGYGTAVDKESAQREIWFPVWNRWFSYGEMRLVFSEGRAQTGVRAARNGADFARAVSSYGVDAGISAFSRFGFVKGRVGGDNYHTAISLGEFRVEEREASRLLLELEGWLDRFRRASREGPARFAEAARRIDAATVDFCRYGGNRRMAAILRALGNAERELANGERFRDGDTNKVPPVPRLSPEWIPACDDGSSEFRIALGLATVWSERIGAIRQNLDPVNLSGRFPAWEPSGNSMVWSKASLSVNMTAVLKRRLIDQTKTDESKTKGGKDRFVGVSLTDISAFLWKRVNDETIEELLWGLILVDERKSLPSPRYPENYGGRPLPRSWATLKLLFMARPILLKGHDVPLKIASEPNVISRLCNQDVGGAMNLALRRLISSGLRAGIVANESSLDPGIEAERMAAALLIPVTQTNDLVEYVLRPSDQEEKSSSGDPNAN